MKSFGNVFVFGDSYSTFEGWNPEGYYVYYRPSLKNPTLTVEFAEDTWWHLVVTETGSKLVRNDSWSGSTVCYRTYGGRFDKPSAFVGRLQKLNEDGFFKENRIDTFFVFGGTNDVWAGTDMGAPKYENLTEEDNEKIFPAFCSLISGIKEIAPDAEICVITNTELRSEFVNGLKEICDHYGVVNVILHDVSKVSVHPDPLGMRAIADQIEAAYGIDLSAEKHIKSTFGRTFIFGDSYSTFEGWNPEGQLVYYKPNMPEEKPKVEQVEKTWWHLLLSETGSTLVKNDSWSGSAVCYRAYGGVIDRDSAFIGRFQKLNESRFFKENRIDTFFIFGGTNDVWAGDAFGAPKYDGITEEDNETVFPAFCTLISGIKKIFPNAEICVITNCDVNTDFENGVKEICEHYGVTNVMLHDISKLDGHPDENGMRAIADMIKAAYGMN